MSRKNTQPIPNQVRRYRRQRNLRLRDVARLTGHASAAIISRELGIPCVIGTKMATKVLQDGDVVEVNANHGNVMFISKGKNKK